MDLLFTHLLLISTWIVFRAGDHFYFYGASASLFASPRSFVSSIGHCNMLIVYLVMSRFLYGWLLAWPKTFPITQRTQLAGITWSQVLDLRWNQVFHVQVPSRVSSPKSNYALNADAMQRKKREIVCQPFGG